MKLPDGSHLTYCTNIHPGEGLAQVRDALERHVRAVKRSVCPDAPFGVGLRLSARAAGELLEGSALTDLKNFLEHAGLYVFTINGFPYGPFHGTPVKAEVYLPDWRSPERLHYTGQLAKVLATLLPQGLEGSISTVPVGFKAEFLDPTEVTRAADNLIAAAGDLHNLERESGRRITLALEPEPCCHLETIDEAVAFFTQVLRSERAISRMAEHCGITRNQAATAVQRHLGLCLDTCHAAVEYEDPADLLAQLDAAAIRIAKVQLSSGLRIPKVDAQALTALSPYADTTYLHQVVERRDGLLRRFTDLPEAFAAHAARADGQSPEWRVHVHVPVFLETLPHFGTTQNFLCAILDAQMRQKLCDHLEVETYTFDVLPSEARCVDVDSAIARELSFCLSRLQATGG
ncbi:MAG: metabolite traffic protein EboE [Myxococcales bacterium]|nr:metabolite traffic protein EboE [Myxococcales bacterium]